MLLVVSCELPRQFFVDNYFLLLILLFYVVFAIFMWLQQQGYTVFGVTDDSFQTTLRAALRKLDLPYEETVSRMRLTSVGVDLQANVQSWMGVGHLRIKDREHKPLLHKIIAEMNGQFTTSAVAVNMRTCVFYVAFGLLMFGMSGYLFKINRDLDKLRLKNGNTESNSLHPKGCRIDNGEMNENIIELSLLQLST